MESVLWGIMDSGALSLHHGERPASWLAQRFYNPPEGSVRRVPLLACLAVHRVSTVAPVGTAGQARSATRRFMWSNVRVDKSLCIVYSGLRCPQGQSLFEKLKTLTRRKPAATCRVGGGRLFASRYAHSARIAMVPFRNAKSAESEEP